MDGKQKMAVAGAGMVVAGSGLIFIGIAMMAPAIASWTGHLVQKSTDRALDQFERVSRTVGTVAGIAQRAITEAARGAGGAINATHHES